MYEYIKTELLENKKTALNLLYEDQSSVSYKNDCIILSKKYDPENIIKLSSPEDIINWLSYNGYDNYKICSYRNISKFYEDTMFLTRKDAEDHLKKNAHNYDKTAHTYCMTAVRSPRVEKLIKLLQLLQTIDYSNGLELMPDEKIYVRKLKQLLKIQDTAVAHDRADKILIELLSELGYHDIIKAYHSIDKWYE